MKNKTMILVIIIGVALLSGGFFGGYFYQKKKGCTMGNFKNGANGNPPEMTGTPPSGASGRGNGGPGGGGSSGEIISKDDKSITIKMTDGSTKTVYFSDSTTISKNENGSISDLAVGTSVSAMGTTNSDKSVTAQNIMIQAK